MASAQVLPSSRKQEHLQAGKRRLEEFRKKKAAERAKKTENNSQPSAPDLNQDSKQPLDAECVRITDSGGAGTSDGPSGTFESFFVPDKNVDSIIGVSRNLLQPSLNDKDISLSIVNDYNTANARIAHISKDQYFKEHDTSKFARDADINHGQTTNEMGKESGIYNGSQGGRTYGSLAHHSIGLEPHAGQPNESSSSDSSFTGTELFHSKDKLSSLKNSAVSNPALHTLVSPPVSTNSQLYKETSDDNILEAGGTILSGSSLEVQQDNHNRNQFSDITISKLEERNFSSLPDMHNAPLRLSESTGYNAWSSSNYVPQHVASSEFSSRRSRPSFLDSLNVHRGSLGTPSQQPEPDKKSYIPNFSASNDIGSSAFQKPLVDNGTPGYYMNSQPLNLPGAIENSTNHSVSSTNGTNKLWPNSSENLAEERQEFPLPKENEDFATLEQHIEDLTQEKFSLQRALEASRALSESLAAENSSLTDNYNQQRSVVNQLRADLERLQQEIKTCLAELDSVKVEYANAQLECNAADERAKLLASEVIGLEEKALRLRSTELKLERELENAHSDIQLYRKKMLSLEKDRHDLQLTVDALQEEKKLLQSKLRKASASGKSVDGRSPINKKDVSTSTEDLRTDPDTSNPETRAGVSGDAPIYPAVPENEEPDGEISSVYLPPEQLAMIQKINALISELALEKEELLQALASKSSQCSKLENLNKELSGKLEVQTQRLELLTAQNIASGSIPAKLPDSLTVQENTMYADEGDEVVERVLGWIMKLFPGGPSRRRTSKLL
ncbi:hypothetical protein K2173_003734 [Erythroxylum novogranatense]|uniref:BLISTER n=1 Tax=Erythroxylum novogranatense TaxID=1862640 RepID=A0AAV8TB77_9ROSI|nr:hypothetical protein K2173_003734 [Erythroxylum novogranatense]